MRPRARGYTHTHTRTVLVLQTARLTRRQVQAQGSALLHLMRTGTRRFTSQRAQQTAHARALFRSAGPSARAVCGSTVSHRSSGGTRAIRECVCTPAAVSALQLSRCAHTRTVTLFVGRQQLSDMDVDAEALEAERSGVFHAPFLTLTAIPPQVCAWHTLAAGVQT